MMEGVVQEGEVQPRTLYVGNLDPQTTEDFLFLLFSQMGPVAGCKIIQEPNGDPYAFVEFFEHQAAASALAAMNKRSCFGKEMKVNWATSPNTQSKTDTSKHYHIFVGDLSQEIETQALREAFAPFGEISDCRVVRDPQTLKSKGFGFVSFVKKQDAESAIAAMNGQWLGNRSIRTNWATRKPPPPRSGNEQGGLGNSKHLNFEEVYNQSSVSNCTVYCGGLSNGISEELMQRTFSQFGQLYEIRVFKDKGFAFIRFSTKEAATNAIVGIHNTEINGQTVKCSWGKESGDGAGGGGGGQTQSANQQQQFGSVQNYANAYGQQQMLPQWYNPGYPAAAAAAAAQMQNPFNVGGYAAAYGNGNYGQQQAAGYIAGLQGMANAWGQGIPGNGTGQHQGQAGNADAATAAAYAMMQAQFQAQNLQVQNQDIQSVEKSRDSVASAYTAQYPTHGVPPSKNGLRHDVPLVMQLENGGTLVVSLQVKFYKSEDTHRSSWGSSLHCIEYECSYIPGSQRVLVTKETYRLTNNKPRLC